MAVQNLFHTILSTHASFSPFSQKRRERFWAAVLLEEQKPGMVFVQCSFYSPHPCVSPFGLACGGSKFVPYNFVYRVNSALASCVALGFRSRLNSTDYIRVIVTPTSL